MKTGFGSSSPRLKIFFVCIVISLGRFLYSNKSTLKRGSILFYGINPGYDQVEEHRVCWKIGYEH